MKKFIAFAFLIVSSLVICGCCSDCKKECKEKPVRCDLSCAAKKSDCKLDCAKHKNSDKCPLLGEWEFFTVKDDKLVPLAVSPQPKMELCKDGVFRFYYSKKDKPMVAEGKWKVEKGTILIGDKSWKKVQSYTIVEPGVAETSIQKDPHLPAGTRLIIRKK